MGLEGWSSSAAGGPGLRVLVSPISCKKIRAKEKHRRGLRAGKREEGLHSASSDFT